MRKSLDNRDVEQCARFRCLKDAQGPVFVECSPHFRRFSLWRRVFLCHLVIYYKAIRRYDLRTKLLD